jgi:hypothetical protein
MTTITKKTVILASEITDRDTFHRVVNAYKKAGFPTDEHCTVYENRSYRLYFGMGNFAIGYLPKLFDDRHVITLAELLGGDV